MRPLWTYHCDDPVRALAVAGGKDMVCVGTERGECLLLDSSGALAAVPNRVGGSIGVLATNPDCTAVFAGGREPDTGRGFVAACAPGVDRNREILLDAPVTSLAVFGNGPLLAAGTADGQVVLFDTSTTGAPRRVNRIIRLSDTPIVRLAPFGHGESVLAMAEDGTGWAFQPDADSPPRARTGLARLSALAACVDGQQAVAVHLDGNVVTLLSGDEHIAAATLGRCPACDVVEWVAAVGSRVVTCAGGREVYALHHDCVAGRAVTQGQVTGLDITAQADVVVVATSTGSIHAFAPPLTADQAAWLDEQEGRLRGAPEDQRARLAGQLYTRIDRPELAVNRLDRLAADKVLRRADADRLIGETARHAGAVVTENPVTSLVVADAVARIGQPGAALPYYQRASEHPPLRAPSLRGAGDCFRALGALSAAQTSYRRSTYHAPTGSQKRLLYELACRWQDQRRWHDAARQFEILLSWDTAFRDTLDRYTTCHRMAAQAEDVRPTPTTSAEPVTRALHELAERELLEPLRTSLHAYDASAYARYEISPTSDTVKKRLEMANLLALIDPAAVRLALDVGTATFRYPKYLRSLGIPTVGIDIQDEGVLSWTAPRERPGFVLADAAALPFRAGSFDLVTCMMGTVNHLTTQHRRLFLAECRRVLRPGGRLVLSCWDPACPFQGFLTMYSPSELLELRSRLVSVDTALADIVRFGFADASVTPFCLFPDWMSADLHTSPSDRNALARLSEFDAETRRRWPAHAGQMFLVSACLPTTGDAPDRSSPKGAA